MTRSPCHESAILSAFKSYDAQQIRPYHTYKAGAHLQTSRAHSLLADHIHSHRERTHCWLIAHSQDSASDVLSRCRMRIRSLTSKLSNMLKGYGGEVSEQGGRICVAMAGGGLLVARVESYGHGLRWGGVAWCEVGRVMRQGLVLDDLIRRWCADCQGGMNDPGQRLAGQCWGGVAPRASMGT
eukprot:1156026-Pelagomonas_calceolata.AAC.6